MSFVKYIKERRITDDPAGDFTREAKMDTKLPDAKNWGELASYLGEISGLIEGVIPAAREVWKEYERQQKASPQIIVCPNGDALVVLQKRDYDALILALEEAEEDAADAATYDARKAEMLRNGEPGLDTPKKTDGRES